MPPLPVVSGREAVRAFERGGWRVVRQRGSHIHMRKVNVNAILTIPDHRELDRGTLRSILRAAGIGVEEFLTLLS